MKILPSLGGIVAGALLLQAQVDTKELLNAEHDNESWLMYGRNYSSWRYSTLDEINTGNVNRIVPAWIFQTGRDRQVADYSAGT